MIETGIKGESRMKVTDKDTAESVGSGTLPVFATPVMALLIEKTAAESVSEYLENGDTTVGTMLDIAHSAPSSVGAEVVCTTEVIKVDRAKIRFAITVTDGSGVIGSGFHERFKVQSAKFMNKSASRLSNGN